MSRALIDTTIPSQNDDHEPLSFDPYGDRKIPPYELVNVRVNADNSKRFVENVGVLKGNDHVTVNLKDIVWPGNKTEAPTGVFISNHLRVSISASIGR